jgi:transcriptional regulator with XRE-family HTH domain
MSRLVARGFQPRRLRAARLKKGWSLVDVARLSRVDAKTIGTWEDEAALPYVDKLLSVARTLGVPLPKLVVVPPRLRMVSDWRTIAGVTPVDAAKIAGVSTSFYGQMERGERAIVGERAERLAAAFGCGPAQLAEAWERARTRKPKTPA